MSPTVRTFSAFSSETFVAPIPGRTIIDFLAEVKGGNFGDNKGEPPIGETGAEWFRTIFRHLALGGRIGSEDLRRYLESFFERKLSSSELESAAST